MLTVNKKFKVVMFVVTRNKIFWVLFIIYLNSIEKLNYYILKKIYFNLFFKVFSKLLKYTLGIRSFNYKVQTCSNYLFNLKSNCNYLKQNLRYFSTGKKHLLFIKSNYLNKNIIMEFHNYLICEQDIKNKHIIIFFDHDSKLKAKLVCKKFYDKMNLSHFFEIQNYEALSDYITIKFNDVADEDIAYFDNNNNIEKIFNELFKNMKKHLLYKEIIVIFQNLKKFEFTTKNENKTKFFESLLELLNEFFIYIDDTLIFNSQKDNENDTSYIDMGYFLPITKMYKIDKNLGLHILPDTKDVTFETVESIVKENVTSETLSEKIKNTPLTEQTMAEKIKNTPLTEQTMAELEEAYFNCLPPGVKQLEWYTLIVPETHKYIKWSKNSHNYESKFNFLFFMYRYQGARLCRLLDLEGEQMEPIIFSSKRKGKLMYPREFRYDIEKNKRLRNANYYKDQLNMFTRTDMSSLLSPLALREHLLYKKYNKIVPIETLLDFRTLNRNFETNFERLDIYDALYLRHTLYYDVFLFFLFYIYVENCVKIELYILYEHYKKCKANKFKTETITNAKVDRMRLLIEIVDICHIMTPNYLNENLLVTTGKLDDFIISNIHKLKINNLTLENGLAVDYNFHKLEFHHLKPLNIYSNFLKYPELITVHNLDMDKHKNLEFSTTLIELYELTRCLRTHTIPTGLHDLPNRISFELFLDKIYGYPFYPIASEEDNRDPMYYKRTFLDTDSKIGPVSSFVKPF